MRTPAVVLQHGETSPPGLLGEWASERGIPLEIVRCDLPDSAWPELTDQPFLCCLGSRHSPRDAGSVPEVDRTLAYTAQAVARDIPVLGLCYGGQVLAAVTGGGCEASPGPENGWYEISSEDPETVAAGPWLEWHYDRIVPGPEHTVIARTEDNVQAFTLGPHLGTQFHPEATPEIVLEWARRDAASGRSGLTDGEARVEAGRPYATSARMNAFALFDAFRERARSHEMRRPT